MYCDTIVRRKLNILRNLRPLLAGTGRMHYGHTDVTNYWAKELLMRLADLKKLEADRTKEAHKLPAGAVR